MNVSKIAMPMKTFQEKYGPLLGPGGRYHPPNCQVHYKVAIIIPYRKREEHLQVFIQHMHPFLQRQQIDYGIFVVEQSGIGVKVFFQCKSRFLTFDFKVRHRLIAPC